MGENGEQELSLNATQQKIIKSDVFENQNLNQIKKKIGRKRRKEKRKLNEVEKNFLIETKICHEDKKQKVEFLVSKLTSTTSEFNPHDLLPILKNCHEQINDQDQDQRDTQQKKMDTKVKQSHCEFRFDPNILNKKQKVEVNDWQIEEFFQKKEKLDRLNCTEEKKQNINLLSEQILISLDANDLTQLQNLLPRAHKEINKLIQEENQKEKQGKVYRPIINELKWNQLSQINWKNCGNYFFTCLSKLDLHLFENFMTHSNFQHLWKSRIISFYKKICTLGNNKKQEQFETAIACVKWYSMIIQSRDLYQIESYLQFLFFDLWLVHLYQGKNLEFVNVDSQHNTANKKNNRKRQQIISGVLQGRDGDFYLKSCKNKFRERIWNDGSRLCIQVDNVDYLLQNKNLNPPFVFGIFYNDEINQKEFWHLNVPSIPNTEIILDEFFVHDMFYQDLITEGLNQKLYILLNQFPHEICLLITQYLRSMSNNNEIFIYLLQNVVET